VTPGDGKQGRGVLKIKAKDEAGNESELELPLWVVKEPLASKADFRVFYDREEINPDGLSRTRKRVRLAADGAGTKWMPKNVTVAVRLGELGAHLASGKVFWKAGAAAEKDLGALAPSVALADTWEKAVDFTGATEGAGKLILELVDGHGNKARQELDGFGVDMTGPTATISTASTPGAGVSISLSPAPADTGSGVEKTMVHIELIENDTTGTSATSWGFSREFTGGAVTLPFTIFKSGNYTVRVEMMDKVGNEPAAPVTGALTVT